MTIACEPHQQVQCVSGPLGTPPKCSCVGPQLPLVCQAPSTPVCTPAGCACSCTVTITIHPQGPQHPDVSTAGLCGQDSIELALVIVLARLLGAP